MSAKKSLTRFFERELRKYKMPEGYIVEANAAFKEALNQHLKTYSISFTDSLYLAPYERITNKHEYAAKAICNEIMNNNLLHEEKEDLTTVYTLTTLIDRGF